jgi:NAD(P)-dependent dehydrogenase (short-subunit alcohol dehydrogenase family)
VTWRTVSPRSTIAYDVLVNNAGTIARERKESQDGYELTFAVNYLSHFLLTRLLLPLLKDSAPDS